MTLEEILKKVHAHGNGQFFWIDIQTDKTKNMTAAARNDGHTCFKFSHMQVRKGVEYENMKSTQEKRAAGIAPAGGSWGHRSEDPSHGKNTVYYSKDNNKVYLTFEPVGSETAINAKQVKFIVDGIEMTYEEVANTGFFTEAGLRSLISNNSPIIRVSIENIINIY